jgi:GNAT superfamily N-acetyltransferase
MTIPSESFLDVRFISSLQNPNLYKGRRYWELRFRADGLWPQMLNYDAISLRYSDEIDRLFPEFQMVAVSQADSALVVGVSHAVPLHLTDLDSLPDEGWDWAVETAVLQNHQCIAPNVLCGLSITVLPQFQRRSVGKKMIQAIRAMAFSKGLLDVIMPVRPISKVNCPHATMDEFLALRDQRGLHTDPWLRAHQMVGGRLLGICSRSMTVVAPIFQWEIWCDRRFSESGDYLVDGGLLPVKIDTSTQTGIYQEPNIWVAHQPMSPEEERTFHG